MTELLTKAATEVTLKGDPPLVISIGPITDKISGEISSWVRKVYLDNMYELAENDPKHADEIKETALNTVGGVVWSEGNGQNIMRTLEGIITLIYSSSKGYTEGLTREKLTPYITDTTSDNIATCMDTWQRIHTSKN